MKKIALFLTLALVLAFAAPVFANPFSDVPADHWAYEALSKLADDGIINGNPDGTFKGGKAMTRYEMAMVTAKAIAAAEAQADKVSAEDQAAIAKLAAEFGTELNTLGVKVAGLEKKIGNVKFTGDARFRYLGNDNATTQYEGRARLTATATVNDKFTVVSRLTTGDYNFTADNDSTANNRDNATTKFDTFYVNYNGKLVDLTAGRQEVIVGKGTYFDDYLKGVTAVVPVSKYTLTAAHGRLDNGKDMDVAQLDGIKLFDKLSLGANFIKVNSTDDTQDRDVYGITADYAVNSKVSLFGEYVKSNADTANKGYNVGASFKGFLPKTNLTVSYAELEKNSYDANYTTHDVLGTDKDKIFKVKANYELATNSNLYLNYTDLKGENDTKNKIVETGVEFKF